MSVDNKPDWWAKEALKLSLQNDILKKIIDNDKKDRLLRVFVCSPLRGDLEKNIALAKRLCQKVVQKGHASFAPHAFYTQFLDDNIEEERNIGIHAGMAFLKVCDELWVYDKKGISSGMQLEIDFCNKNGIKVIMNPWGNEI